VNVIRYARRRGRLECVSLSAKAVDGDTEFRFEESISGALEVFNVTKKIDGKSCVFNTGTLEDGFYYPKIYLEASIIELEGFEISNGKIKLIPKNDEYVRLLSAEIEALRRECAKMKDELLAHDKKINGNPIF